MVGWDDWRVLDHRNTHSMKESRKRKKYFDLIEELNFRRPITNDLIGRGGSRESLMYAGYKLSFHTPIWFVF